LLVAGQELGKTLYLQAMLTFEASDSDRWKRICKGFYDHNSKASGGLLGLMGPNTSASEIGQAAIINAAIGGTAEEERNRTLYVDFDDRDRSWLSPIRDGSDMATSLLKLTQQALARLLSNREVGLHSPKALGIIREVYASNPILDIPDANTPADPATLAEFYQESLERNEIIRQRLSDEGFNLT
jgi:AbiV family abortive infection protein